KKWAGEPCVTKKAGAVTGHDPTRMATYLPERRVTSYHRWGDAGTATETLPGTSAPPTPVTGFDRVGRITSVAITSTGDGATALGATTTGYDPSSGQVTTTTSGSASILREYDRYGRVWRYTDADGAVTTNEFDRFGKPTKVTNPTG